MSDRLASRQTRAKAWAIMVELREKLEMWKEVE